jgi:hypothetical protein
MTTFVFIIAIFPLDWAWSFGQAFFFDAFGGLRLVAVVQLVESGGPASSFSDIKIRCQKCYGKNLLLLFKRLTQ